MYVFYPETLYWVSTNVYLIISYPVPQQRTVHWDDHQKQVLTKTSFEVGVYGLRGEFERLAGFQFLIISPGVDTERSSFVQPNDQKA